MIYNLAMPDEAWTYTLVGQAKKALAKGLIQGAAGNALDLLLAELSGLGPYRSNWPNYTKMNSEDYHCHLKKRSAYLCSLLADYQQNRENNRGILCGHT